MRTNTLPSTGRATALGLPKQKLDGKQNFSGTHRHYAGLHVRAAEFGKERMCLAASSVWKGRGRALGFLSSWDNQSFVFPLTTFFTRVQEGKGAKRRHAVLATCSSGLTGDGSEAGDVWFPRLVTDRWG